MLATRISRLTERPNSRRRCPNRHDYCRRKTARARISDKVCQVSRCLARQSDVMHVELESRKYRWSDGQALLSRASEVFALSLFRDFTTRSLFLSYAKKPTFVGHDDPRVNPTSTEMTTDSQDGTYFQTLLTSFKHRRDSGNCSQTVSFHTVMIGVRSNTEPPVAPS